MTEIPPLPANRPTAASDQAVFLYHCQTLIQNAKDLVEAIEKLEAEPDSQHCRQRACDCAKRAKANPLLN